MLTHLIITIIIILLWALQTLTIHQLEAPPIPIRGISPRDRRGS